MKKTLSKFLFLLFFSLPTFGQIKTGGMGPSISNLDTLKRKEAIFVETFQNCNGTVSTLKNINEIYLVLKTKEIVDVLSHKGKIKNCQELTCLKNPQTELLLIQFFELQNSERYLSEIYGISTLQAEKIKKDMKGWIEGN